MDENALISQAIQNKLGGDYKVETRVTYAQNGLDHKSQAGLLLVIRNPSLENKPAVAEEAILQALSSIAPLKPYIVTESQTNHMERLAKELEYFRTQELALTQDGEGKPLTTIHSKAPEWFRELPKRDDWNITHALSVNKADTGIVSITIRTPKDASPEDIAKNIDNRKTAILDTLAERVVKYTETAKTQQEKDDLKAKVKALEFSVLPASSGEDKYITITIMSKDQLDATKLPGGITTDKVKGLSATNPLLALQFGDDDQDPDKTKPQPHLQKALARAILYSGDKHEEILPYIMGKDDMRRQIGKTLTNLKHNLKVKGNANSDLEKRIDDFLSDPVFKDLRQWNKPLEKQEFIPRTPSFEKSVGEIIDPSTYGTSGVAQNYEPGVMVVKISLPPDKAKFSEICGEIAKLATPAADQAASAGTLEQAISTQMKPLVDVVLKVATNQALLSQALMPQAVMAAAQQQAAPSNMIERATAAMVNLTNRISSWADRMESRQQASSSVSDEALATSILTAAGVTTMQTSNVASAIAASGPTSLITRAEQSMIPGQIGLKG